MASSVSPLLLLATGEPRLGLWCDSCLLPSALEVDVHTMCSEHGSHKVGVFWECRSCRRRTRSVVTGPA